MDSETITIEQVREQRRKTWDNRIGYTTLLSIIGTGGISAYKDFSTKDPVADLNKDLREIVIEKNNFENQQFLDKSFADSIQSEYQKKIDSLTTIIESTKNTPEYKENHTVHIGNNLQTYSTGISLVLCFTMAYRVIKHKLKD